MRINTMHAILLLGLLFSPMSYCIENQLDYTHLKFVHHNTIGRHFKMPQNPKAVCTEQEIKIYFGEKDTPAMSFFFPNTWVLNISPKMQLVLYFAPLS